MSQGERDEPLGSTHEDFTSHLPDLPIEILSLIASFLLPPFYPPGLHLGVPHPLPLGSSPQREDPASLLLADHEQFSARLPPHVIEALDPSPTASSSGPSTDLSAFARSSQKCLAAARPWLWETISVHSGRGWLSIVNALTEEISNAPPSSPPRDPIPECRGPAVDAHRAPLTVPGGFGRYISFPPEATYPYPQTHAARPDAIQIRFPSYNYSPPQPKHVALLLTPDLSRDPSPLPPIRPPAPMIRGRSRSPRRSLDMDTEGIFEVLDRGSSGSGSRSASVSDRLGRSLTVHGSARGQSHSPGGPRRSSGDMRNSSLRRSRTPHDVPDEDEEEELKEDEQLSPDRGRLPYRDVKNEHRPSRRGIHAAIAVAPQTPIQRDEDELLPTPGPYIRHLSFVNFRTIGSRRTQNEAVKGRFVTSGRLEGVLKNGPNLVTLAMTEYVDSALTYPVVEEVFFRGYRRPKITRRASNSLSRVRSYSVDPWPIVDPVNAPHAQQDPPRPTYVPYEDETEDDKWHRRTQFTALQALDLTGCVSQALTTAMGDFFDRWLAPEEEPVIRGRKQRRVDRNAADQVSADETSAIEETEDERDIELLTRSERRYRRRLPKFPAMKRLSLRSCTSLDPILLDAFIPCFTHLTHLDLSNTRVPSTVFRSLTNAPTNLRLRSLSLARCPRLDPEAIVDFLLHSPAVRELVDLNLYVDPIRGNAMSSTDVTRLMGAPCLTSGELRYLDISSAGVDPDHFHSFPAQPNLVCLGLSHMPWLRLVPLSDFLIAKVPNVEILTLTGSATMSALSPSSPSLQILLELHARLLNPCTTVPFSLSNLSLSPQQNLQPGPTRLRVIELAPSIRRAIGTDGGSPEWKVIRSKGGRGWYVDISAGWIKVPQHSTPTASSGYSFARHLPATHQHRAYLQSLSDADGRVSSGVGWHSRKMEVVRGLGMMGREEGMAAAGAFAFEEELA